MSKKFFTKNFKKIALSLAGVLFTGSLVGSAFAWKNDKVQADNGVVDLYYSSATFNVLENATYTDDTGKTGVKLTSKTSGTYAEGDSFTIGESFTGDFSLDFRVTSQNAYTTSFSVKQQTHYVIGSGYSQYFFSDYMNPYLDLKEVAFTFTSKSNPDKYFTVYFYGSQGLNGAFSTTAYVYVPGDTSYLLDIDGNKRAGYGLRNNGTYYKTYETDHTHHHNYKQMTTIYGTSFSRSGETIAKTNSNVLRFDAETMEVYVNAGTAYNKPTSEANLLLRNVATNAGTEESTLSFGSVSKEDFANGYTVKATYTDVTADSLTTTDFEATTKFGDGGKYPTRIDTAYDRYPAMTIYSVNGNSVKASDTRSVSYLNAKDLVSYDESQITVTEEFSESERVDDSRLGLNFKSVQSGTKAEGAGFAFNNTIVGNFEMDFRVTSAQAYTPKHATAGYTHYVGDGEVKLTLSDNVNPYLDLKEVAFTFKSVTNPNKYFTVYMRGSNNTQAFSTTAYVYIPGDTGAYTYDENNNKVYGYGLSNNGIYPYDEKTGLYAEPASKRALWNVPNIIGTSFSNYTATSSGDKTMGALTSNLLKFDVDTMSVYVNSGSKNSAHYNKVSTNANVLLRDLATNQGANPDLALGSLSKEDFAGGYTVSVEFTDVTENGCTGYTANDGLTSDSWSHYCANPTEYDRYANLTIYSINGQSFSYDETGNSQSGILSTVDPVLSASTAEMLVGTTVDVTPSIYNVLAGNAIGTYGTVSYTLDGGASYTAIEKDANNRYIFTPNELGTYTVVYDGFKDALNKTAKTLTITRECGLGFAMEVGASVRMATDGTSGIRFTGSISKAGYDWLLDKYGAENVTFYYTINGNGKTQTQAVEEDKMVYDESAQAYVMRGAVGGIRETLYETAFSATLYVQADDDNYVATANDNVRSISEVAKKAMFNDEYYNSLLDWQKAIIGQYVGYYAFEVATGNFNAGGHAQGTASSDGGRYIYHSLATTIVKQDAVTGEIVGSMVNGQTYFGKSCHLGDITYYNGKLYATLIRSDMAIDNCYIVVIEADKLTGDVEFNASYNDNGVSKPIAKLAYIGKPIRTQFSSQTGVGDYASVSGFGGKYGVVNSVDSVTVGPAFGADDNGTQYLTLGLGMPAMASKATSLDGTTEVTADARTDNDYLVIAQYDISAVESVAVALDATGATLFTTAVNNAGDSLDFVNTYFFYMGYHNYGLQNITYDSYKDAYICTPYGVVTGSEFPNYQFFVVDADSYEVGTLIGNGTDTGKVVSALCGIEDADTGVVGYTNYWGVGVISLGNGYYYLNTNTTETVDGVVLNGSYSKLYKWDETLDANAQFPFVLVK